MADDADIAAYHQQRLEELRAKHAPPFAETPTREGECNLCFCEHPKLAEIPDPDRPGFKVWACVPCRDRLDRMRNPRKGGGGRNW